MRYSSPDIVSSRTSIVDEEDNSDINLSSISGYNDLPQSFSRMNSTVQTNQERKSCIIFLCHFDGDTHLISAYNVVSLG